MKKWWAAFIEWWKTNVFKNVATGFRVVGTLIIPFCYGFIYLFSFWNPNSFYDKLDIAFVNSDNTAFSKNLEKEFSSSLFKLPYPIHFKNVSLPQFNEHKRDYYSAILIPQNFSSDLDKYFKNPEANPHPHIDYYFTYKKNFLVAEGSKFLASALAVLINLALVNEVVTNVLTEIENASNIDEIIEILNTLNLLLGPFFKSFITLIQDILKLISDLPFGQIVQLIENALKDLLNEIKKVPPDQVLNDLLAIAVLKKDIEGKNFNNYGSGLAPYFICIALWIGALSQTFWIVSRRNIKIGRRSKSDKDDQGRWLYTAWKLRLKNFSIILLNSCILSFLQATILFIGLTALGFHTTSQINFFLFGWYLSIIFSIIVLSMIFFFSLPDPGKFLVILYFILNLTSSSGTFPVVMQPGFFQFASHLVPFSYAINITREFIVNTDPIVILINCAYLFLIAFVFLAVCILWWFALIALKNRPSKIIKPKNVI